MPVVDFWIEEEIIPLDVVVPTIDLKQEQTAASDQPLLGHKPDHIVRHDVPPQKLLVDINFAKTDADYLDSIERACQEKIDTLKAVCLNHWAGIKADHETGRVLAAQISSEEVAHCIQKSQYYSRNTTTPTLLTSWAHPDGLSWALALTKYYLFNGENLECISVRTLSRSGFFRARVFRQPSRRQLSSLTALPKSASDISPTSSLFYRFAGILSGVDIAAACCLLTIEHPQFTSSSLQNAQLLDVRGRSYLLSTDGSEQTIFSVDKPRAGERKSTALSPLAHEIVQSIIEITKPLRTLMRKRRDRAWRYLFLGLQTGGRLGPLKEEVTKYMTSSKYFSLVRFYPQMVEKGLDRGTLNLRRIRNTMGVLCWFETGSIIEMSRRLGNTLRVVLEHYIPPALLLAWNTRIIRRFQNTLIVLAAYAEDHLLEVTDFSTMGDLLHFMAQLVYEYRDGTSPIANEIHARFGARFQLDTGEQPETGDTTVESFLNLRLSARSLGYLYAFADYSSRLDSLTHHHIDPQSGLSVQQFVDLAKMIRHACENEETGSSLRELLDLGQLRRFHDAALAQQATLLAQFSRFSLNTAWGDV